MKKQLLFNWKIFLPFLILLSINTGLQAQEWKAIGPDPSSNISAIGAPGTVFASDIDGIQYVCYPNMAADPNNKKVIVKKLVNGKWIEVGSFKTEDEHPGMDIEGHKIYVGYSDFNTSRKMTLQIFDQYWTENLYQGTPEGINPILKVVNGTPVAALIDDNNTPFIMRYDGSSWTKLASLGIPSNYSKFSFDVGADGMYWVAYTVPGNAFITIRTLLFNTWVGVQASGKYPSANITAFLLKTDKTSIPHLLYKQDANTSANIVRFDATSHTLLSPPATESSNSYSLNFSASNTPYVAYNATGGHYITVRKSTNNSWSTVGNTGFSSGSATTTKLSFNGDIPYVFFLDNTGSANVSRLNNNKWEPQVSGGITAGQALPSLLDIAANTTGTPYLSYSNFNNDNKLSALKWNGSSWLDLGTSISNTGIISQAITTGLDGEPIVAYLEASDRMPVVKKYNGSYWQELPVTVKYSATDIKITGDKLGNLFLAFTNGNSVDVSKFDGSAFQPFPTQGALAGNSLYKLEQILITKEGRPVIVSLDNDNALPQLFKYYGSGWEKMTLPTIFADFDTYNFTCKAALGDDDNIYLAYSDGANMSTLVYNGSSWTDLGWSNPQYGSNPTIHVQGNTPYLTYTNLDTQLTKTLALENGVWTTYGDTLFEGENNTAKTVVAANQMFASYDNSGAYVKVLTLPVVAIAPQIAAMEDIKTNIYRKPITLTAPVSTGTGSFTYSSSDPAIASIDANVITIKNSGQAIITATQQASAGFTAGSVTFKVTVSDQGFTAATITPKAYGNAPFQLQITADGSQSYTYGTLTPAMASVSPVGLVSINGPGAAQIVITQQASDTHYENKQLVYFGIAKRDLYITRSKAISKIYDGNNRAAVEILPLTAADGLVGTDEIVVTLPNATYTTINAETGKTITYGNLVISGAKAANYNVVNRLTSSGTILPKPVQGPVSGYIRAYDQSVNAYPVFNSYTAEDGLIAGDDIKISYATAAFADANAGSNKPVSFTGLKLEGASAANYELVPFAFYAEISKLSLKARPNSSIKVYGNHDPEFRYTINPAMLPGDVISGQLSRQAGENTGVYNILQGTLSAGPNYDLTSFGGTLTINKKEITPRAVLPITKAYNGTTDASVNFLPFDAADGLVGNDAISFSYEAVNYDTPSVGLNKPLTISNPMLSGQAAENYQLVLPNLTAAITARVIDVYATAPAKVYGTADPAFSYTLSSDLPSTSLTGQLSRIAGEDAGIYKLTLGTLSAGNNYSLNFKGGTLTITKAVLTAQANNQSKVSGQENPEFTGIITGFVNGDDQTALYNQVQYQSEATRLSRAGNYTITPYGAAANNYSLIYQTGVLTITPAPLIGIIEFGLTPGQLFENATAGTVAGTFKSASGDPEDTFTYSLISGSGDQDNAVFAISGNQLITRNPLDFEQQSIYSVSVKTTSSRGSEMVNTFQINLLDVNEAPTLDDISNQSICTTTEEQTIPLLGLTAGPEQSQTLTLAVFSDNDDLFESLIANESGPKKSITYKLKPGAVGTAKITILVIDNGSFSNGGVDRITKTFLITANSIPVGGLRSDKGTGISKGEAITLIAEGGASYAWSDNKGLLANQSNDVLTVRPSQTTTYTVVITNASGCAVTRSITIQVNEDYQKVKATNILTPNGDGINDLWIVENIDQYPDNEVRVFDKGGRTVFTTKSYNNTWNGHFQGTALAEGTYYYIIDFGPGRFKMNGFITIIHQ